MRILLAVAGAFGALLWAGGCLLFLATGETGAIHEAEAILVMGFGALIAVTGLGLCAVIAALDRLPQSPPGAPRRKTFWNDK